MLDKLRQWMYYCIIFVVSLIALVFLPMLSTEIGLEWAIPDTTVGWIVWGTMKAIVAVLNVLIFHCFIMQGKLNVAKHPNVLKAREILGRCKEKKYKPRSPQHFYSTEYLSKGSTIFLTTAFSTVAFTQALLSYDYVTMLTYLFVIIMGVIFGLLEMRKVEDYEVNEFLEYAQDKQKEEDNANNK